MKLSIALVLALLAGSTAAATATSPSTTASAATAPATSANTTSTLSAEKLDALILHGGTLDQTTIAADDPLVLRVQRLAASIASGGWEHHRSTPVFQFIFSSVHPQRQQWWAGVVVHPDEKRQEGLGITITLVYVTNDAVRHPVLAVNPLALT